MYLSDTSVRRAASFLLLFMVGTALLAGLLGFMRTGAALAQAPEGSSIEGNIPADIIFVIDESGSMDEDIADVISNVETIANVLSNYVDPLYGLVGFGTDDEPGHAADGYPHTHADLTDTVGLLAGLNELIADGDTEPGVLATSYAMTQINGFRDGAGVCVLLITDEDSDYGSLSAARNNLDAREATWFGVVNPGFGDTEEQYGPDPGSLSEHTEGAIFDIDDFRQSATPVILDMIEGCIVAIQGEITLGPLEATNPVGTNHIVTATVTDQFLNPLEGITVTFEITSGPNVGLMDEDVTDSEGKATFEYTGNGGPGTDVIVASFEDEQGVIHSATAIKHWVEAAIILTKTVGLDNGSCAPVDYLEVPAPGTEVYYCYTVQNTGNITLTEHELFDDQLGQVLPSTSYDLGPGDIFSLYPVTGTISSSTLNVATWTAQTQLQDGGGGTTLVASDTDDAYVFLIDVALDLVKTVGLDNGVCAGTDTLVIGQPSTDVYYCYTVTNTGNYTLTHHELFDDKLGLVLPLTAYDLGPGDTFSLYPVTATISSATLNVATWTAAVEVGFAPLGLTLFAVDTDDALVTEEPTDVGLSAFGGAGHAPAALLPALFLAGALTIALLLKRREAR